MVRRSAVRLSVPSRAAYGVWRARMRAVYRIGRIRDLCPMCDARLYGGRFCHVPGPPAHIQFRNAARQPAAPARPFRPAR